MATTSTRRASSTTRAKKLPSPQLLGTKRVGKAADAPLPGEEPLKTWAKPTEAQLVHALQDAGGFHRDALYLELAVGLALFATRTDGNKVDLQAKKALRAIYEQAGYACKTPVGEDYKTVSRRIGVSADLFAHLGGTETIHDWVGDTPAKQHVNVIMSHLREYPFDSINGVLAHIGKPVKVNRTRTEKPSAPAQAPAAGPSLPPMPELTDAEKLMALQLDAQALERKIAEKNGIPAGRVFSKGPLQLTVPFNAGYDDVMALALELMTFAKTQMQLPVEQTPAAQVIQAMTPPPAAAA